jgi:uncharacterized protein
MPELPKREMRFIHFAELRAEAGEGEAPHIRGYAALFDTWSEDLGWFREKIHPGAFANTLKEADVRALWNHDPNYVLGRNKSDTLQLREDEKGLAVDITPPDTQWARDLMTSMKRQDINQMSFAFQTIRDDWNYDSDPLERTLVECNLFDVAVVTYPAYTATSAAVRSLFSGTEENIDSVVALIFRASKKLPLTREEQDLLRSYLPAPEGRKLAFLRQRLHALELETEINS